MKYKENTEEELRNKVKGAFQMYNTALLPLEECIDEVMRLMKAEYNRGYAEGYLIAYEEHA